MALPSVDQRGGGGGGELALEHTSVAVASVVCLV